MIPINCSQEQLAQRDKKLGAAREEVLMLEQLNRQVSGVVDDVHTASMIDLTHDAADPPHRSAARGAGRARDPCTAARCEVVGLC